MQRAFDPWQDADLAAVAGFERQQAQAYAAQAAVLARMLQSASAREQGWDGRAPWAGLVMEVAGTMRLSQRTAEGRLADAEHLVANLPGTHAALAAGTLFVPHAKVMIAETLPCSRDVCAEVERRLLPGAPERTPGELRHRVQQAVLSADPGAAQRRHEQARQDRATWVKPAPDGMALQGSLLTAVQGRRFDTGLTALLGRSTVDEHDTRTDQHRRADLLADLPDLALELLDRFHGVLPPPGMPSLVDRYLPDTPQAPAGNRASRRRRRRTSVLVQVPVCAALGLSEEPVWLDGYGWITAGQGLALLPEADLRKACLDVQTGRLVALQDPIVPGAPAQPTQPEPAKPTATEQAATAQAAAGPAHDRRRTGSTGGTGRGGGARAAGRAAPPEPADVARAVHQALQRMATEITVVGQDDPSLRTEPQHDPSEALREFVDLRDGGCDGPGCSTTATVNDLDHETPWPAGPTTAGGLRNRSRRCHGAKHNGWTVEVDEAGWSTWTSPGGRRYRRPPRYSPPPPPPPHGRHPHDVLQRMRTGPRAAGENAAADVAVRG